MSDHSPKIPPKGVEIKIELPYEVAEYLVTNGNGLLSKLKEVFDLETKRFNSSTLVADFHIPEPDKEWDKLARYTDREARRRFKANKEPYQSVVSGIAKDLGVPYSTLIAITNGYKQRRKAFITEKREINIIRLHLIGWNNARIAKSIEPKASPETVAKIIEQNGNILQSLRNFQNKTNLKPKISLKQSTLSDCKDLYKVNYNNRIDEERILTLWLYRQFRKSQINGEKSRYEIISELAETKNLPRTYVETLIKQRGDKVKAFIKKRRYAYILRHKKQGLTHKKIAKNLGIHFQTIRKIILEVRAK